MGRCDMNIKIDYGHGVTEIVKDKGEFRVKRNNAKLSQEIIDKIIEVMKEGVK